jgi:hypothetical protein
MRNLTADFLMMPWRAMQFGMERLGWSRLPGGANSVDADPVGPTDRRSMIGEPSKENPVDNSFSGRDGLYRGLIDWTIGSFTTEALDPGNVMRTMIDSALRSPELLRLAVPGRTSRVAWTELRNKVEAFGLFATADTAVGFNRQSGFDLLDAVRRVTALEPYPGLWTTEGLGYYYAVAALQTAERPERLLSGRLADQLPARCLVPLHTGMGLAIALKMLLEFSKRSSRAEVGDMLAAYLKLCRDNAREGYTDAVIEALGLIAKIVRPRLLFTLDEQLLATDPEMAGPFWHGVGRGLYFSLGNILPCGSVLWPSLRKARAEPPHDLGRDNAVAGFAWAVTLVNIRDPEVLEMLLRRQGAEIPDTGAFANGVNSAATVWYDWAPETPYLAQLCRYRPKHADPHFMETWNQNAASYCDGVLTENYNVLTQRGRLGDLFEFHPS